MSAEGLAGLARAWWEPEKTRDPEPDSEHEHENIFDKNGHGETGFRTARAGMPVHCLWGGGIVLKTCGKKRRENL